MGSDAGLTPSERDRLRAIRNTETLEALRGLYDAASVHEAYFAAKREWRELLSKGGHRTVTSDGVPGTAVRMPARTVHVHGITHADTEAERDYLRGHVTDVVAAGDGVLTEQGIRRMYFQDLDAVYEMDDIRWALAECQRLDIDSALSDLSPAEFEGLTEDVRGVAARFREEAFSLIDSGRDVYGDAFADALGDVASEFLMSHEELATGEAFEAFRRTREACEDPGKLADLQAYYHRTFLPQPLEREWLWHHDPELEIMTHARNERMADYAVANTDRETDLHLIVGAAHQPGVAYYLERHRDGARSVADFEPIE